MVEQDSIKTDVSKREVRFKLKDRTKFDEPALKEAFKAKQWDLTVKAMPK